MTRLLETNLKYINKNNKQDVTIACKRIGSIKKTHKIMFK